MQFLVWLGRYFNVIREPHNSLACKRAAIYNGALIPGIYQMEATHASSHLSQPVPPSCMGLVKQVCKLQNAVMAKGLDPLV